MPPAVQHVLDGLEEAAFVVDVATMTVVRCNPAAVELLGQSHFARQGTWVAAGSGTGKEEPLLEALQRCVPRGWSWP